MAEAVDDIELEELDREREAETNEEGETSFIDNRLETKAFLSLIHQTRSLRERIIHSYRVRDVTQV